MKTTSHPSLSALALGLALSACGGPEIDDGTKEEVSVLARASTPWADRGDINGDGRSDIALTAGVGWNTMPVAFSNGNGTFSVTNLGAGAFAHHAQHSGAKPVSGDFNGDGRMDVALVGGIGWNTVPVAFSNGNGTFNTTNLGNASVAAMAVQIGARPVSGDFNGDGRADIALVGGAGWNTLPVAFSNGNGTFNVTNLGAADFAHHATQVNAKPVSGDFNGDGRTDIAMVGGVGWNTVPVAFSNGNGTFSITNLGNSSFATMSAQSGARPVSGDFNGDGRGDIALTGGAGWNTVPVAFSNGNGTFNVTNLASGGFHAMAVQRGAQPVSGDFNGDGRSDIALTGGAGWNTLPVAFSNGNGTFNVTNLGAGSFPAMAASPRADAVGAYTNGGGNPILLDTGYIAFGGGVPVGGGGSLTLYPDGTFLFAGHMHNSGAPCYVDSLVWGVKGASGQALSFTRSGSLGGTACGGSRDDDWYITGRSPDVAAAFPDLRMGYTQSWQARASLDWGAMWAAVRTALGYVARVVAIVGPIVG